MDWGGLERNKFCRARRVRVQTRGVWAGHWCQPLPPCALGSCLCNVPASGNPHPRNPNRKAYMTLLILLNPQGWHKNFNSNSLYPFSVPSLHLSSSVLESPCKEGMGRSVDIILQAKKLSPRDRAQRSWGLKCNPRAWLQGPCSP